MSQRSNRFREKKERHSGSKFDTQEPLQVMEILGSRPISERKKDVPELPNDLLGYPGSTSSRAPGGRGQKYDFGTKKYDFGAKITTQDGPA